MVPVYVPVYVAVYVPVYVAVYVAVYVPVYVIEQTNYMPSTLLMLALINTEILVKKLFGILMTSYTINMLVFARTY